MDFEEYYQKFEKEAKKQLSAELWDRGTAVSCPKEFAKELFDSDAFSDDPESAAEEYAEFIQEMDKEGSLGESRCEDAPCGAWAVEYKDIWDEQTVERFDDEKEAWARYNELESRTFGDMSDILWVKEPKCLAEECGSSASSLGAVPTGGTEKDEATGMKYTSWFEITGFDEEDVYEIIGDILPDAKEIRTSEGSHGGVLVGVDGWLSAEDVGAVIEKFLTDIVDLAVNEQV